jgi:hypothetical protein
MPFYTGAAQTNLTTGVCATGRESAPPAEERTAVVARRRQLRGAVVLDPRATSPKGREELAAEQFGRYSRLCLRSCEGQHLASNASVSRRRADY